MRFLSTLLAQLDRLGHRLHRERLALGAPEARALHHEHRRAVEHPVQSAQQRVVACEELIPVDRRRVAGEDQRVRALLLVPPVDDVEEHVGARPAERAPADLVDDQACRLHQGAHNFRRVAQLERPLHLVPQLRRLQVVGLVAHQAAFAPIRLREVRLADSARAYERDVLARVQVGQRRELPQRRRVAALDPFEVEVPECLGRLLREPAQPQQRLDGLVMLLPGEVLEHLGDGFQLGIAEVVAHRELGHLLGGDRRLEPCGGIADARVGALVPHHRSPPKSNFARRPFLFGGLTCDTIVLGGTLGSSMGCASRYWSSQNESLLPQVTGWAASSRERSSL